MNVSCPSCETVYRVDPERVPATGVTARCRQCDGTFRLGGDGATAAPAPEPAAAAEPAAAPAETAEPARVAEAPEPPAAPAAPPAGADPAASMPAGQPSAPEPSPPGAPTPEPPAPPATEPATTEGGGGAEVSVPERPAFGPQDPDQRAKRIARALVSDITVYHPERVERSRAEGTLRTDFRDEILKSWDEYVQQVGDEMARGTNYFREALNEILAQGRKVF